MPEPSRTPSPAPADLPAPVINQNAAIVLGKRYLRKGPDGRPLEDETGLFWRVAQAIASQEANYSTGRDVTATAREFYDLMTSYKFLPNSPTLMNAGTPLGQLAACFVLPVGDSMEEIFDAVKYAALIHKSGGGTGFAFSRLRAKHSRVGSTGGVASGPVSFMRIFNTATEQVKQGGTRRGANMGILRVDHPDIKEFITCKEHEHALDNFNISVGLTEAFMRAADLGHDYDLIDPRDGIATARQSAREIFELLVRKAWESGDPGIVFLDRINRDNPTPALGEIESTNPCGEQPLLPYEACNLGSINLALIFSPAAPDGVDWEELARIVALSVRFLDNVIDASEYPLPVITEMVRKNRKIGLGVMGFADLLYLVGVPYDSPEALVLAERLMLFIQAEAQKASAALAALRGPFPAFDISVFPAKGQGPLRNATTTTIAPTGTLSIIAGCSSGVEPLFALSFARHVMDGEKLVETNPYFRAALEQAGLARPDIIAEVARKGSVALMEEIPEALRRVFVTAMDIEPVWHLRMQAAFQKYTDNAVSKTVNLPGTATKEEIAGIYRMAFELGCKGVTVYRDGCKTAQVLCTGEAGQEEAPKAATRVKTRPDVVYGFTQKVKTGLGELYLTVNEVDGRPFEVFATIGKSGRSVTAKAEAIGRLVSLALRSGVDVEDIVGQLKGIGGENPVFQKKGLLLSIPDAVSWVLESRYMAGQTVKGDNASLTSPRCPDCGADLVFEEGCHICKSCGFTKCG